MAISRTKLMIVIGVVATHQSQYYQTVHRFRSSSPWWIQCQGGSKYWSKVDFEYSHQIWRRSILAHANHAKDVNF